MSPSPDSIRQDRRLMAYTAAAIYGGGAFVGLIESFIPGGPSYSIVPGLVALVLVVFLLAAGPRLPRWG